MAQWQDGPCVTAQRLVLFSILIILLAMTVPSPNLTSPPAVANVVLGPQYCLTADVTAEQYKDGEFTPLQIKSGSIVTVLGDPDEASSPKIFVLFEHREIRVTLADIQKYGERIRP